MLTNQITGNDDTNRITESPPPEHEAKRLRMISEIVVTLFISCYTILVATYPLNLEVNASD